MIYELITALENLQEAKAEYREAAKDCQYDRDYFLHREIQAVNDARDKFEKIFKDAVASVVIDAIKTKSYLSK